MSSGFGTNDKKDIDELVKKIELKIKDLRSDFTKDVTVLKNQLTVCATELDRLKELLESVSDYSHSEYEKLERKSQEFEEAIADIRTKLNTIQYNEVLEGKCASGINEYPIYARYAEKDISGNSIPSYYATKSEVSGVSSTLSGDYTQKIADISGASQSALSSVSALLAGRIESESQERVNADEALNAALENESTERKVIDDALEDRIAAEETAREQSIGEVQVAIQEEETSRTVADENLSSDIEAEKERSIGEENRIENKLIDTADALSGLIQEEIARATTEENRLQDYIDEVVDVSTSAFEDLEQTIDSVSSTMTSMITDEKEAREHAIKAEQIRALSAEGELDEKIEDEETRAINQENQLNDKLDTETTNRTSADNNLQSQIDAIEATQNVVDLVGTHAELMNYDTSKLKENDKIQVLQDETKENQSTIYSFVDSNWIYVGHIGSYYTKAEVDTKISEEAQSRSTKDTELDNKITAEETRAKGVEFTLQTNLENEIGRATDVEQALTTNLENETNRATEAEAALQTSIANETSARESAISDLQETITNEIERSTLTDQNIENTIDSLSSTVSTKFTETYNYVDAVSGAAKVQFNDVNDNIEDLYNVKQDILSAGDGIAITNDVVSHSIKIIENNSEEDTIENAKLTVYLKNNHYKIITLDPTVTEIHFWITKTESNVLQETGFEFQVPENSVLNNLEFSIIDDEQEIYTIIPKSYKAPNIYQGTIVNYKCTIGEYKVE